MLCLDGEDLRHLPLIERKLRLRSVLPRQGDRLLYCDYVDGDTASGSGARNCSTVSASGILMRRAGMSALGRVLPQHRDGAHYRCAPAGIDTISHR